MLTQIDLQNIKKLIDTSIDTRVPKIVDVKLKAIQKKLERIEKILVVDFDFVDRRTINHGARLDRVDKHLSFPEIPESSPTKAILKTPSPTSPFLGFSPKCSQLGTKYTNSLYPLFFKC